MKKLYTSILFFLFLSHLNAQCVLDMTATVDGSGNIVTFNNSTGADPSSYVWYVYNMDMGMGLPYLEYIEPSVNTISYAPLYVGNYLVCLVANESGTNAACDSLCEPLTYTQSMMNMQNTNDIGELTSSDEVSIYPNPAHDRLYVISDGNSTQKSEFRISDIVGRNYEVEYFINDNGVEIDVRSLPNGVYFITIQDKVLRFVVE